MISLAYGFDEAKNKQDVYTESEVLPVVHTEFDPLIEAKQDQHLTRTATLLSSGWSNKQQTLTIAGVTATNTVFVAAVPASQGLYSGYGIICTGQGNGTLTFSCDYVPDQNINVNIVIFGLGA